MITLGTRRRVGPGAIASVNASPGGPFDNTLALAPTDTVQLDVHAFNVGGAVIVLTGRVSAYVSSDPAVATVTTAGLVTAIAEGSCTITPYVDGFAGTAISVTVDDAAGGEGGGTEIFASDWSTLGSNAAAWGDGGIWPGTNGGNVNCAVDTKANLSLGAFWPTDNGFKVGCETPAIRARQPTTAIIAVPTNGYVRYWQYYFQMAYDDTHGVATNGMTEHGCETNTDTQGGFSASGMTPFHIPRNDGTWYPGFLWTESVGNLRWVAYQLQLIKNRTYRLAFRVAFGASTATIQARIYDMHTGGASGTLVATEANYLPGFGNATTTMDLATPTWTNGQRYQRHRVGTNGPSSNFPLSNLATGPYLVFGKFRIAHDNWLSP